LLLPLYHIFCICQSHPLLSSASHTSCFNHPVLDGNCKTYHLRIYIYIYTHTYIYIYIYIACKKPQ
jgi:hypothetical protein